MQVRQNLGQHAATLETQHMAKWLHRVSQELPRTWYHSTTETRQNRSQWTECGQGGVISEMAAQLLLRPTR